MAYAFKFDCYDVVDNEELDRYDRKIHFINVSVVADTEGEAETKVKALVTRQKYELDGISELSEIRPLVC